MTKQPLLTIGYQQATHSAFIDLLKENDVELLADVRARAQSRKPGFSKSNLAASLAEVGIDYAHFRDLGTPPEGRAAARRGDRETLKRVYAGQLDLPEALVQIAQLQAMAKARRTCLLCYCREPESCHRSLLIEAAFDGWPVAHLHPSVI